MAVSKRLRFEILRRDNHTCRYCGASAPDVPLRVDHVTPEALGGRTEPSNLVTACEPCNSGKSSVALDGAMVEDIKADALRLAELQRQAYSVLVDRIHSRTYYANEWKLIWEYQPIPEDWENTLGRWFEMGVPLELVLDAARTAQRNPRAFVGDGRFRYFCGIVWNQVSTVTAEAAVKLALDGAWVSDLQRLEQFIDGLDRGRAAAAKHSGAMVIVEDWVDRFKRAPRDLVWDQLDTAGVVGP